MRKILQVLIFSGLFIAITHPLMAVPLVSVAAGKTYIGNKFSGSLAVDEVFDGQYMFQDSSWVQFVWKGTLYTTPAVNFVSFEVRRDQLLRQRDKLVRTQREQENETAIEQIEQFLSYITEQARQIESRNMKRNDQVIEEVRSAKRAAQRAAQTSEDLQWQINNMRLNPGK